MIEQGMLIAERYEILEKTGVGGMADVYKAQDIKLGRFVAVKVLKEEFSEDITFVNKFRTEAQSAAGLEHPNIVNVYDVGSEKGFYYIVMEFVEGITLKDYIRKKGRLSYKEALSITIQAGRGLQAAHEKNIIHRDVKPQNIMISTDGKVKVTDFGIARAATTNTIHSDVMGSVHYASPEQARNGYVSNRSDIYSLGIVMYEMVTGKVPFDGDSTVQIAIQHLQDEMVPPGSYVDDLPISLEKIILKCTQKSPDRRYESMENLLLDLRKALINPDEDFVTFASAGDATRVISDEELKHIQNRTEDGKKTDHAGQVSYEDQEAPVYRRTKEEGRKKADEEDGFFNARTEKVVTALGIIAAIVIVIFVIFLLGRMFDWFHFGSDKKPETTISAEVESSPAEAEGISLISLEGMTLSQAEEALSAQGLLLSQSGTESSDAFDEGEIISQDPAVGSLVQEGDTVYVVVSSGSQASDGETRSVPSVKGISESRAIAALEEHGFTHIEKEYEYSDQVGQGEVFSQSPAGGEMASTDATITIKISQGGERIKVPSVKGETASAAREALTEAGFDCKESEEYSSNVEKGSVISQSVAAGEYVPRGSTVTIVVSKGPESTSYSYQGTVNTPEGMVRVEKAEISLYQSGSSTPVKEYTVTTFPYSFFVNGIEGSGQGTLSIVWYYIDDEGNTQTAVDEQKVSFTAK